MGKAYKIAIFTFEMIFSLVFLILSIMFTIASIHNIKMTEEIKDFIDRATFEFQEGNNYYYTVEVDNLESPTINITNPNEPILGKDGDIFLMPQSRMDYVPLFAEFVSYLFGGHAGVVTDDGENLVEAMGGSSSESFVYKWETDLYSEERTVVGLRVNCSLDERKQAAKNALSLVSKNYNYLFIFNTLDSYYCTDICSRVYGKEFGMKYNIDTNGFHVSLQDLFRSKDTYISFVKYKVGNETHIYYLKNKA
jgi:hypothetical protein